MVLDSQLLQTELADTLRRAAALGDTHRVTDQLRAEGVDTLHFDLTPDGRFKITPVGLESGGGRGPGLKVEARLRILSGSGAQAQGRVDIEVGLTRMSWIRILAGPPVL